MNKKELLIKNTPLNDYSGRSGSRFNGQVKLYSLNDEGEITWVIEHEDLSNYLKEQSLSPLEISKCVEFKKKQEASCYCGRPVDNSSPDCMTFNLCKDHVDNDKKK